MSLLCVRAHCKHSLEPRPSAQFFFPAAVEKIAVKKFAWNGLRLHKRSIWQVACGQTCSLSQTLGELLIMKLHVSTRQQCCEFVLHLRLLV